MDGGEREQRRRGQRQGAPAGSLRDLEQPQHAGEDERRRPGEVRDREDRVPAAELGKVEIERLHLAAEDVRVARRLCQEADARPQDDEDQAQISKLSREQPPTQPVDRVH